MRPTTSLLLALPRAVVTYVRTGPFTTGYLAALVVARLWLDGFDRAEGLLSWLSTNLDNLARHPVGSLAGSLFVINGPVRPALTSAFGGTVITVGLGIGLALWWLEVRAGSRVAAGVLVAGHVGATLLTAGVIVWAVGSGRYPPDVRSAIDVGVSYGAEAALAAVTVLLPRPARPPWALFVLAWPLLDADWFGLLPDFSCVGHLISAVIGAGAGWALRRARSRAPSASSGPSGASRPGSG